MPKNALDALPAALADVARLAGDDAWDPSEVDLEMYDAFYDAKEADAWIRAWTGNKSLSAADYRVFGQDGTGGMVACWLAKQDAPLEDQPVVFFGSEGELGVVAKDLADFIVLLAHGVGPYEATSYGADADQKTLPKIAAVAQKRFPEAASRKASVILADAHRAYPDFETTIRALCG